MRSIIRQNADQPVLPDFRNLGTILRILVAVNAGGAAVLVRPRAVARGDGRRVDARDADRRAVPVPGARRALAGCRPGSSRLPFATGAGIVALVTLAAGVILFAMFRPLDLRPTATLLRWLVWALLAVGALAFYFHLRARALSPAITEARLQALQARIRPHFLFNSINAVLSLIRSEPQRAEMALQDMADLFRVLMRDNRDLAPLADEVELCRQYLELEQLRLGDRLQVDWNVKSMPGDALVPPLVLQPLLENAVYHGIEPSSAPGVVSINLFLTRGEVHAILKNPYRAEGGQPSLRQQDGARQRARAPRAALRRRGEPRVARHQGRLRSAHPHALPHRRTPTPRRTSAPAADERVRAATTQRRHQRRASRRAAACRRRPAGRRPWLNRRCAS